MSDLTMSLWNWRIWDKVRKVTKLHELLRTCENWLCFSSNSAALHLYLVDGTSWRVWFVLRWRTVRAACGICYYWSLHTCQSPIFLHGPPVRRSCASANEHIRVLSAERAVVTLNLWQAWDCMGQQDAVETITNVSLIYHNHNMAFL